MVPGNIAKQPVQLRSVPGYFTAFCLSDVAGKCELGNAHSRHCWYSFSGKNNAMRSPSALAYMRQEHTRKENGGNFRLLKRLQCEEFVGFARRYVVDQKYLNKNKNCCGKIPHTIQKMFQTCIYFSDWSHVLEMDDTKCDFPYASDLVLFIKTHYRDDFSVGVAGYPDCHPHSRSLEEDLNYLKLKVLIYFFNATIFQQQKVLRIVQKLRLFANRTFIFFGQKVSLFVSFFH